MSAGNIGGSGTGLYQFLRSISANQTSPTSSTASTTASTATSATAPDSSSTSTQGAAVHHGHKGHGGGGGAMFKKIEDAVTSALQSAQSDGSSSSDPNQTIEDAISKVLNGASSSTDPSQTSTDADGDNDGTQAANGNDSASRQAFFQTLQQYGIDPQQFRQDLMSAFQQAKNGGTADPSTAFKSFPPGTAVDVAA